MNKEKIFFWIKILSLVGILLAIYLLYEQIVKRPIRPCTINSYINCDAVITGEVAKTLGVPTPLYGLIGYIVIFFAAYKKKTKLLLGMTTFGLLFCLRIAFIELVYLRVICPVCIMCQLIMITVFVMAISVNKKEKSELSGTSGEAS